MDGPLIRLIPVRGAIHPIRRAPLSHAAAAPSGPLYNHALSDGVTTALTIGAGATVLALIVTLLTIRVRREDLPDGPVVM